MTLGSILYLDNIRGNTFLVAECKRANPALANWVFIKTPYVRRGGNKDNMIIEGLDYYDDRRVSKIGRLSYSDEHYQLGVEIRTNQKSDSFGKGRGAIEEAVAQFLRGLNGLMERAKDDAIKLNPNEQDPWLIPVVFTTANLWITDAKLDGANLENGRKINLDDLTVKQVNWLWF